MHQAPSTPLHTHQLTNNTPKHRTNVATINKLATKTLFSRASHFTRATFHTYLRFKLVIYYVIMVRWFECSQIFSYLAGGWFFNIYSWFYTGFLFRPKFSLRLALADFGGSVVGSPLRYQVLKNVAISILNSLSFLDVVS